MKYRRDEAFRFAFGEPIDALFQITKLDDKPVTTAQGKAQILDISPEGLRICSELNIPDVTSKTITLMISFTINDVSFDIEGIIVWKKMLATLPSYGIKLQLDHTLKTNIINQLKIYSKKQPKK
ncbi:MULTISPECIES: PilZ domain-containing protein [Lysinibacillus]|uniref:PilZ domain-containing protein n=1 Tax=Lysinibacillus antri TaxID=2498145 RepID=A0A3S0R6E4_9BACI|nr:MULTISPECIES: PilZ domain-containing protein [Lysinibacillus]RUL52256.1 PilZ domain-containing protein [Lysinibacillus antri]TSI05164.1 PilZ domain-containing protein [Lysinibacillus sp. BW-2-10]